MQNSKELFAERQRLADSQALLMADDKADEALVIEGQIKQLDITLEHVLDEEEKLRNSVNFAKPVENMTLAQHALGARDEFTELPIGFRKVLDVDPTVVTVTAPREIELELPAKQPIVFPGFASTLQSVPAKGSVDFKQRSTQYGAPDAWAGVTNGSSATKSKVIYTYKDETAHKETIAGYVPISKDTLKDYPELTSIINNDLVIDLQTKRNAKCVNGNNSNGIVGIENIVGILSFDAAIGGLYYEAIRLMRTKVMKTARRVPTHVVLSTDIKEAIDLYKTETGLYQFLGDNVLWGMNVVEDVDTTGILVYDAYAAKLRPVHGMTVEIGYVNDQFIKNELCILAEETTSLQVVYPDAFCFADKEDIDKTPTVATPPASGSSGQSGTTQGGDQ